METITYKNILTYLNQLPDENDQNVCEETSSRQIPDTWSFLGLGDDKIGGSSIMYKPWTHYALGFYPYNICEIYKDEKNRILLSYIELGGHFPFRRNFIITKKSPFIFEPVSFTVTIKENENEKFILLLDKYGLDLKKIASDLLKYKDIDQITYELDIQDIVVGRKYFNQNTKEYYYTIISCREIAVEIKNSLNNIKFSYEPRQQ